MHTPGGFWRKQISLSTVLGRWKRFTWVPWFAQPSLTGPCANNNQHCVRAEGSWGWMRPSCCIGVFLGIGAVGVGCGLGGEWEVVEASWYVLRDEGVLEQTGQNWKASPAPEYCICRVVKEGPPRLLRLVENWPVHRLWRCWPVTLGGGCVFLGSPFPDSNGALLCLVLFSRNCPGYCVLHCYWSRAAYPGPWSADFDPKKEPRWMVGRRAASQCLFHLFKILCPNFNMQDLKGTPFRCKVQITLHHLNPAFV